MISNQENLQLILKRRRRRILTSKRDDRFFIKPAANRNWLVHFIANLPGRNVHQK